jgi:excisionase family DNA binding protein
MAGRENRGVEMASERVGLFGATVGVEEAAGLLGIGRTLAYRLARRGELPVPVIRIGRVLRIPTAPLRALLGLAPDGVDGAACGGPGGGVGGGVSGPGVAFDQDA